jgi:hypothetical protein
MSDQMIGLEMNLEMRKSLRWALSKIFNRDRDAERPLYTRNQPLA